MTVSALLITGTVGVGKTTTAEQVGRRLGEAGTAYAVIDLDEIRRFWPMPPGDPFGVQIEVANLTAVAANYLRAGAEWLVLAGVVENQGQRQLIQAAVGVPLSVVRLRLSLAVVRQRLAVRHAADPEGLSWHLDRAGVLEDILTTAQAEDLVIETDGLDPAEVAERVLDRWSGRRRHGPRLGHQVDRVGRSR